MTPFEDQLGAAPAEIGALCPRADREARHVDERHQRQAVGVAQRQEMRTLVAGVGVEHAAQPLRLVGDEADRPAAQSREGRHQIAGEGRLQLEHAAESAIIASTLRTS